MTFLALTIELSGGQSPETDMKGQGPESGQGREKRDVTGQSPETEIGIDQSREKGDVIDQDPETGVGRGQGPGIGGEKETKKKMMLRKVSPKAPHFCIEL